MRALFRLKIFTNLGLCTWSAFFIILPLLRFSSAFTRFSFLLQLSLNKTKVNTSRENTGRVRILLKTAISLLMHLGRF